MINEQLVEFLFEYKELCLKHKVIVDTDSSNLYLEAVDVDNICHHIGILFC